MPQFRITAPDGAVYKVTGPEGSTEQDALAQIQSQRSAAPDTPRQVYDPSGNIAGAETALALGTGFAGSIAGGFAGLGTMTGRALGLTNRQPGDVVRDVQGAMTYQPRTEQGQQLTSAVTYPFEKLAQGADVAGGAISEATGSPALGAGVNAVLQTAVPYGAFKGAGAMRGMIKPIPENVKAARSAGLAITPSEGSGGFVSRQLESLSGEPRLAKKLSVQNQPAVNDLIAKDIGLPEGIQLSRDGIYENIDNAGKAYEVVRRSGRVATDKQYANDLKEIAKDYEIAAKDFPDDANPIIKMVDNARQASFDANSAMSKIITLRKAAKKAFSQQDSELGRATIDVSNALEEQIGRHLEKRAMFDPSLAPALEDFRQARVTIAKSYSALKALNDATGDINPQAYAKMLEKNVPLSGEAKTVGEMAQAFPRSMQNTARIKSTGATLFDVGAAWMGHNAPLLFARPITRSLLASKPYQGLMARPGGLASLLDLQSNPGVLTAEIAAEQRRQQAQP